MQEQKQVFPFVLYNITGKLIQSPEVVRLISADQQLFAAFFSMAAKLIATNGADLPASVKMLISQIRSIESKTFSINDLGNSTKLAESIRRQLGHHVTSEYLGKFLAFCDLFHTLRLRPNDTQAYEMRKVGDAISDIGEMICRKAAELNDAVTTNIDVNISSVIDIYDIDEREVILLDHAVMLTIDQEAFNFWRLFELSCERPGLAQQRFELALVNCFKDAHGCDTREATMMMDRVLNHKQSKVLAFGIVKMGTVGPRQLSSFWTKVLTYNLEQGEEGFDKHFVTPRRTEKKYSGVIARLNEKMLPLCKSIIEKCDPSKSNDGYGDRTTGVNFLLYGPKSLDKDQALMRAFEGVEFDLYEAADVADSWGDEAAITWAAQRILSKKIGKLNVLLVREAETVLSRGRRRMSFASIFGESEGEVDAKQPSELDSDELLLTKSETLTVWYTSDPRMLSAEAVGKFMLHLEVIPGTRADRKAEVEKIADGLNLPADVRLALSKYMQLGANQVETAAHVVKLLELQAPGSYETLLQLVEESQKALGRDRTEELRTSVTKYDLGLLNISSKFTPAQVIEALKKKRAGTLCFYGLPGTGKTQLAEYIAEQLDMPLLVKRASDILSKWVGDNERNIADMFREARAEGAVLLLDEADSFLRDRALSRSSWEVTMVNELLQGMERHQGIFICASNLFQQLDAAALRRFTFKFNFLELDEHQRVKMFMNESGVDPTPGTDLFDDLMSIRHLTPGDFATVKRQSNLLDTILTPEEWIKQLSEEAKAKLAGMSRNSQFEVDRV